VDDELEVIREQMDQTRASLADKIEALESQVRETVQTATDTVTSAVDGAKEVVSSVTEGAKEVVEKVTETVENVKESLSVSRYVEQYPWASLGVATVAGFLAGQFLPTVRDITGGNRGRTSASGGYSPTSTQASSFQTRPGTSERSGSQESKTWGALHELWNTALSTVESLAVGTLMSAIKEAAQRSIPEEWKNEVTRMIDEATTKLGGKVMHGNPLEELFGGKEQNAQTQESASHRPAGQGART
jgi:ElaB/YqjD/DUF883 family membrane-anchored ribosome-binding protein